MRNMTNRMTVIKAKKQAGFTAGGVILGLLLATLAVKVAYVVAPPYYDNYLVTNALKEIAERHVDDLKNVRKSEISSELSSFYTLNGVRSDVIVQALEVERLKERSIIKIDYEVRTNFGGNADVVLVFKNHLDSSKPDECCTPSEKY